MKLGFDIKLKQFYHGLAAKFFLWIIIFIIIPVCFFSFYAFKQFEGIIQNEVSQKSIENIARIEADINNVFDSMIKMSNVISFGISSYKTFDDGKYNYYERAGIIRGIFNNITDGIMPSDTMKITIFDKEGNIYSNWSRSSNDYNYIKDLEWVRKAVDLNGHMVWSSFEPSFIDNEDKKLKNISMARKLTYQSVTWMGDMTQFPDADNGILIMSLSEEEFRKIFKKYTGSNDQCILITDTNSNILTRVDDGKISESPDIQNVLKSVSGIDAGYVVKTVGGKKYLVNSYMIRKTPWTFGNNEWRVVVFTLYDRVVFDLKVFSYRLSFLFTVFIAVILCITLVLTQRIVKPIKKLDRQMQKFNPDNELADLDVERRDEIGHLNAAFYKMAYSIKDLFKKLKEEHEVREKYRFESLRAQLNPHFLFNTLNTIRWMAIIRKADNIVESIDALGTLLRFSMNRGNENVTLKEELENTKSYVFIQNSRYGGRYQVNYNLDHDMMELKVIKFILQPVVENSVIHGFKDNEGKGLITIDGCLEGDRLILEVKDNGVGMNEEQIRRVLSGTTAAKRDEKKVTGLGVSNVNERIKVTYGPEFGIEIYSGEGKGTTVRYVLPVIRGDEGADKNVQNIAG